MEKCFGERYVVTLPIRVEWTEDGQKICEEGLTENIGLTGTLVYLPSKLPRVGSEVDLIVIENPKNLIKVTASVLRVERNAARPKCALLLNEVTKDWEENVWRYAARLASTPEEDYDDY